MFLDYRPCTSESIRLSASSPLAFGSVRRVGDLPGGLSGKESTCNAGDTVGDADLIPRSRRSPRGGNGNPLQYSCLGNPMDREAWRATVHGVTESHMTWRLSTHTQRGWESLVPVVI